MTYVIHGATGAQGAPVVTALAAAGKSVVALTRHAAADVAGARVRAADYSASADLTEAYRDAEGVFIHLPIVSEEVGQAYAHNVVDAVRAAQPARVVFSTSGAAADARDNGAVGTLLSGLADSGVSHAVIEPRLYFENLLLPHVIGAIREQGVLRYPLPAGFRVSWASHLDIADVAVALFERPDITGVVSVGQDPAISGQDLAEAFAVRLGQSVVYEGITPEAFRVAVAPVMGEGPAAGVASYYSALAALPDHSIASERSAQKLLGLTPRTASRWLSDMALS